MRVDELIGAQRPRLWTSPSRHVQKHDGCRACANPEYPRLGCGDYVSRDMLDWGRGIGYELDDWQQWCITEANGVRPNGKWAAKEACVICTRQNGKGTILEVRELSGLFLLSEEMIIHTAHEFKLLSVTTPVLTANRGWATMGDLRTGDCVYAPDGKPTRLVAHPWEREADCYRITFADGQEVVAGGEHLWDVTEAWLYNGKTERKVVTTLDMLKAGLVHESGPRKDRVRRVYRWRIDLPAPFEGVHAVNLPVDPWLLGAWLGDGTSNAGALTVGAEDLSYVTQRLDALGESYSATERRSGVWTVYVHTLVTRLKAVGVFGDKHIPDAYLTASEGQRRELLAGLMDTDGTVSAHQLAITMVREDLMEQVTCLVRGLGYRATLREFRASLNGKDAGPMWRVQFASNGTSPFGMPRKAAKITQLKTSRSAYNAIVSIERASTVPMRCITVDHPSGCYLVGEGFLVTHNTSRVHFERVRLAIEGNDSLKRRVKEVRTSHGEESIKLIPRPTLIFASAGRYVRRRVAPELRFLARSRGSGRGFTCNCLIYDEAMILTEEQVGASIPTMSSVPNAQMWYMGSSGLKDSLQLAKIHRRIEADDKSLFGADWSIDPHLETCPRDEEHGRRLNNYFTCTRHDDRDDPRNWAKANPAFGLRITYEFTRDVEFNGLPATEFDRERLGVGEWPAPESPWLVISEDAWRERSWEDPGGAVRPIVFGIDAEPDGNAATITAAWYSRKTGSEIAIVEMPRDCHRKGTAWAIPRLKELMREHQPAGIVIPSTGAAADLKDEAVAEGIEVMVAGPAHEAAAFAHFRNSVKEKKIAHLGERLAPTLWRAMGSADVRETGDGGKAWSRKNSSSDISPVTSATLAAWGLHQKRRGYNPLNSVG